MRTDPPQTEFGNPDSQDGSQSANYQPVTTEMVSDSAPQQYVVKKGDTLWDISGRFLKDPWYWPELWHVNPEIKNPHLIYPGDVISLFYIDGKPQLGVNYTGPGYQKLSPQIRTSPLGINSGVAISAIKPFLLRQQVVTLEELKTAAHVLDSDENRLIYGSGDNIYVHGLQQSQIGKKYSIFRTGEKLHDPETGELLGHEAIYTGDATITKVHEEVATARISDAVREILRGDRLLPLDQGATGMHFWPHSPPADVQGSIISISNALSQVSQYQVVAINLGSGDGIEPGHIFATNQSGRVVSDPYHRNDPRKRLKLPNERTGLVMIYRTFKDVSYGLIMESGRAVRKGDAVTAP